MNELTVFNNAEFGQVRTTIEGESILLCGADIAKALGYSNPSKALGDHCKGVTKRYTPTSSGTQEMSFIPEGDVYRLIVRSNLPAAEKFEKWVFDEVLPTIRKHGMWAREELLNNPDVLLEVVTRLKAETDARKALEAQNAEMVPKVEYYDTLVARDAVTCIRETAKLLEISEKKFIDTMLRLKFLYRDQKGRLAPYADKNRGYFKVKEYTSTTSKATGIQTLVTVKGREHFAKLFAS